jgi:hypothetical protein
MVLLHGWHPVSDQCASGNPRFQDCGFDCFRPIGRRRRKSLHRDVRSPDRRCDDRCIFDSGIEAMGPTDNENIPAVRSYLHGLSFAHPLRIRVARHKDSALAGCYRSILGLNSPIILDLALLFQSFAPGTREFPSGFFAVTQVKFLRRLARLNNPNQ